MLARNSLIGFLIVISIGSIVFFSQLDARYVFGIEENLKILQRGIISTEARDYAISNDFETRIIQDGKIMRLSGITVTGEAYYVYQKIIENEIIVKGKILVDGVFVPIYYIDEISEPVISLEPETELIMTVKVPHHTYARYPCTVSVMVFDAEKNPQPIFGQTTGTLENVFVNVTITNHLDNFVTSFSGKTDSKGLYRGSYIVDRNLSPAGTYNVGVVVDDNSTKTSQTFTTFFRGDIKDFFKR